MLKNIFISVSIILLLSSNSYCDDAFIMHSGGTIKMIEKNSTEIQMTKEVVTVYLKKNYYILDATFEFFNHGEEKEILVGFPDFIGGWFEDPNKYKILDFQTWFNGKSVSFEKTKYPQTSTQDEQNKYEGIKITGWFTRKLLFPKNTVSKTRVRYKASYSRYGFRTKALVYLYGTGSTWKGNIKVARFIVKANPNIWVCWSRFGNDHRIPEVRRLNEYEHEYVLKEIEPSANETWDMVVGYELQPWEEDDTPCTYTNEIVPDALLHTLSLKQLRLFRNTFFALHGKIFESEDLKSYFKQTWWYKENKNYSPSELAKIEKSNVDRISSYEENLRRILSK
jgi:hypothetical protein